MKHTKRIVLSLVLALTLLFPCILPTWAFRDYDPRDYVTDRITDLVFQYELYSDIFVDLAVDVGSDPDNEPAMLTASSYAAEVTVQPTKYDIFTLTMYGEIGLCQISVKSGNSTYYLYLAEGETLRNGAKLAFRKGNAGSTAYRWYYSGDGWRTGEFFLMDDSYNIYYLTPKDAASGNLTVQSRSSSSDTRKWLFTEDNNDDIMENANVLSETKNLKSGYSALASAPDYDYYMYDVQASGYYTFGVTNAGANDPKVNVRITKINADGTIDTTQTQDVTGRSFSFKHYLKYGEKIYYRVTVLQYRNGKPFVLGGSAASSSSDDEIAAIREASADAVVPYLELDPRGYYTYSHDTGPFFFAQHAVEANFLSTNLDKTFFPKSTYTMASGKAASSLSIYTMNNGGKSGSLLTAEGCPLISSAMVLRNLHKTSKQQLHDVRTNTTGYVLPDPYTVMMVNLAGKQTNNVPPDFVEVNNSTANSGKRYEITSITGDPTSASFSNIATQFGVKCLDSDRKGFEFAGLSAEEKAQMITDKLQEYPQGVIVGLQSDAGAKHFIVIIDSTYDGQKASSAFQSLKNGTNVDSPNILNADEYSKQITRLQAWELENAYEQIESEMKNNAAFQSAVNLYVATNLTNLEQYFTVIDTLADVSWDNPEQTLDKISTSYRDLKHAYRLVCLYE